MDTSIDTERTKLKEEKMIGHRINIYISVIELKFNCYRTGTETNIIQNLRIS